MPIQSTAVTAVKTAIKYLRIFPGPETQSLLCSSIQEFNIHPLCRLSTNAFPISRSRSLSRAALQLQCLSTSKHGCHPHFYWRWWSYFELDRQAMHGVCPCWGGDNVDAFLVLSSSERRLRGH